MSRLGKAREKIRRLKWRMRDLETCLGLLLAERYAERPAASRPDEPEDFKEAVGSIWARNADRRNYRKSEGT